jgi:hypothetical protein
LEDEAVAVKRLASNQRLQRSSFSEEREREVKLS